MPKTPLPDSETPPDPRTELLADLDARIGEWGPPVAAEPAAAAEASGGLYVRPEQVDLVLRLHQLGAAWRERVGKKPDAVSKRIDRFEIVREVGQGGFATVYEATDTLLGRAVALKVAHPEALVSPGLRRRFLREAELASKVTHPNLVTIHDIGECDGTIFIAEEFCSGGTLATWLGRHPGPVPPRLAAEIVRTIAQAIDAAHHQSIVHRDIKPSNVLLSRGSGVGVIPDDGHSAITSSNPGWCVKLCDFGLGTLDTDAESDPLSRLTRAGATLGTPAWMAPEQIDHTIGSVGPATDVHALGLLLDRLLIGSCRWIGNTDSETMRRILLREPEAIDRDITGVPRDLLAVCRRCLARQPQHRYARAGELAADLSRFLLGVPTRARPLSRWERVWRFAAGRPWIVAGWAALLMATVISGFAVWGWSVQRSAAIRERDQVQRVEAAILLQRGLEELRAGSVVAARERFAEGAAIDPSLDGSFAGRWARRRLWCHREILFDGNVASATAVQDLHALAVSADGLRIAVGAADGRLIMIDASGSEEPVVVAGAHDEINDVAFSPDGRWVATAGEDGRVCLWAAETGTLQREVADESSALFALCWSPDGSRLAWAGEQRVLVIAGADGGESRRFPVPLEAVEGLSDADVENILFVDEESIVVAGGHQILRMSVTDGHVIQEFAGHARTIYALDISADHTRLVSAGSDLVPRVWDITTGALLATLPPHTDWVQGCTFTADDQQIVTGGRDSVLQVFDAKTGALRHRLTGHDGRIWDVRREPGGTVISAGADGTLRRWAPPHANSIPGAEESALPIESVFCTIPVPIQDTLSDVGRTPPLTVVVVPSFQAPFIVDAADGKIQRTLSPPPRAPSHILHATVDAALNRLAILDSNHDLRLSSLHGTTDDDCIMRRDWNRACWTPTGQWVGGTIGSPSTIVGLAPEGLTEAVIDRIEPLCHILTASPDGSEIAYGGSSVLRVTPISWQSVPRPIGPTRSIPLNASFGGLVSAAWSPDGRKMAVGSRKGNVRILDAVSGKTLRILPGHRGSITSLIWARDGRIMISADHDKVLLTDTATSVAIDSITPGWTIKSAALAGPLDAPDRWLVIGGEAGEERASAEGVSGRGRLLVVDVGAE